MKAGKLYLSRALTLTLTATLTATLAGGCNGDVKEFCARELPRIERQIEEARQTLGPGPVEAPSRSVAATHAVPTRAAPTHAAVHAPVIDRDVWLDWAEDRLKETQSYMDLAERETRNPELRRCLGRLANELVSFHGYCQREQASRMISALDRIRTHTREARRLACEAK